MLYYFGRFIFAIYLRTVYRMKIYGLENVPKKIPFIICSNHLHMLDPTTISSTIPFGYRVYFMAKKELFRNPILAFLLRRVGAFPVNREEADYAAIKKSYQLLKEGKIIGLFPEGTRSKEGILRKAQDGAALIAVRSGVPIMPVAIEGPYRPFKPLKVYVGSAFVLPPLVYEKKEEKKVQLEQMSSIIMTNIARLFPDQQIQERNY